MTATPTPPATGPATVTTQEHAMQTFESPSPITAKLELQVGALRIVASARDDTTVQVEPSDPDNRDDVACADNLRVEFNDGSLQLAPGRLRSITSRRSGSIEVTIELPTGSRVNASLGVIDLQCEGALGECRIRNGVGAVRLDSVSSLEARCGKGDITVDHASGPVTATAASGEVRLRELHGPTVIKNANGETWVGTAHAEVRVQSANGRITIDRALDGVTAKTANGDITIDEARGATAIAESKLGNIELGIPQGVAAWMDVRTTLGQVYNELEHASDPEPGSSTVDVRLRTSLGRIRVRRPSAVVGTSI